MIEKSQTSSFWPSFYEPLRQLGGRLAEWVAPASEASSDDKVYRIAVELPGVKEKDIDITVDDGLVTIKGEKKESREEKGDTWYFSERQYGAFSRSFRLPAEADPDKIEADLKDGVLTLSVAKVAPEALAKSRRIPISKS
ncbi:MAG: Hsp20/alpha crystallin family protein [Paracoccaceae bacterium]|jgi:HSP20 family protein|nr:Hsp20/alpha crystallin family protein [Paracoccaceae bacterium]